MSLFHVGLLIALFASVGCKTHSPSQYTSPRVVGRVLDAQTHQPLPAVQVRRISGDESYRPLDPPKGAQLLEQAPAVRTAADGTFALDSVRDLALFRSLGWYAVSLSVEHARYERLTTTYTLVNATNTVTGEPVVNAGDILLIPLAK